MIGYAKLLAELKNRAAGEPELTEALSLYIDLFSAQARADVSPCETASLAREAPARLAQGLPILAPEAFRPDPAALLHLGDEICTITARHRPDLAAKLDAIRTWLGDESTSILHVPAAYLRDEGFRRGEEAGPDNPLLAFVLNNALHPFLREYAKALFPFIDANGWYRPRCPVCGGEPDFAALEKETGARRLLCSRCDAEWPFWRVGCPFCGCEDAEKQKYSVTDDQVYRLCWCAQCTRYLKTIDLRQVADERVLPVERILTLAMDLAAQQAGYGRLDRAARCET